LEPLLRVCGRDDIDELLCSPIASKVIYEVLKEAHNGEMSNQASIRTLLKTAFRNTAAQTVKSQEKGPTWEHPVAHLHLKRLITHLKPNGAKLAVILLKTMQPHLSQIIATNRGAFVVAAILEQLDWRQSKEEKQMRQIFQIIDASQKEKEKEKGKEKENSSLTPGLKVLLETRSKIKSDMEKTL